MIQFVYPAVFYVQEDEIEPFCVYFPDLDIGTEGISVEEAFLFAKEYLKLHLTTAIKNDIEYERPSKYQEISKKFSAYKTMLVDVCLDVDKIKKTN